MGEGVPVEAVERAAASAAGDLRRARVLANDPRLALRQEAWHAAPSRLDGAGHAAVKVADELLAMIDDAAAPLEVRQAGERETLDARVKQYGERGSGRRALEERHKRELRRHRADELRSGLAVLACVTATRPWPATGRRRTWRRWPLSGAPWKGWCGTPTSASNWWRCWSRSRPPWPPPERRAGSRTLPLGRPLGPADQAGSRITTGMMRSVLVW